ARTWIRRTGGMTFPGASSDRTMGCPTQRAGRTAQHDPGLRGHVPLREAAQEEGRQFEPIVAELTDNAAEGLARAPEDLIWESCLFRLLALRKTTSPGAGHWPLEDYRPK